MSTIEHTIVTTFAQQLLQHDNENILNSSILKSLNIEYNDKLVEHNYGLSKNELKSKDIINLINICTYDKTSELHTSEKTRTPIVNYKDIDKEYYKTYNWLSYIPCLQEGAYRINIGRYIYFKIQNINIDEKSITIFMQDYTYNNSIWGVGVSGTATYKCNPKATFDKYVNTNMFITTTNIMLLPDLYTKIPYEELSWSQNRISKKISYNLGRKNYD